MGLTALSDTIVALSTPPGIGAIGVIRLSGTQARSIVSVFFTGKNLEHVPSHTAHFGTLTDASGSVIDEVLVTVFQTPRSYTGEDTVEISCHGSPYILQRVLHLCLHGGARLAAPGEFTMRAFINGKMDLTQAEAVADVIASESEAAHHTAMHQLRGGFKKKIQHLREELIHFASLIELELDFAEEDVVFADRKALRASVQNIRRLIQPLLQSFSWGNAIKSGVATVIAGRPNAGKSTLLNTLLEEERAIVSDIAGTTRDAIEEVVNIQGIQFRLTDTAGIREAQDTIEAMGVQRTLEKIEQASIVVYVWDVVGGMTLADVHADVKALLPLPTTPYLVVCNKMDRNPHFDAAWLVQPTLPDVHPYLQSTPPAENTVGLTLQHIVPLSAKNGQNLDFLKQRLFELATGYTTPDLQNQRESVIITNARHHDALRRADAALVDVLVALDSQLTSDFIAQDIRRTMAYLGEITGEIGVEDVLGNIFGKFCIGK